MNQDELDRANLEAFLLISHRKLGKPRMTKKDKCRKLLEDLGINVEYIHSNKGYWSHRQQDVMSWEFGGTWGKNGLTVCGGSWVSMTECAKAKALTISDLDEVFPVEELKTP